MCGGGHRCLAQPATVPGSAWPAGRRRRMKPRTARGGPRHGPSVRVRRDHLATSPGGKAAPAGEIDSVADETQVAIAEKDVHAAGMEAASGLPARVVIGDTIVTRGVRAKIVVVERVQVVSIPPARALVEHPAAAGGGAGVI